MTEKTPQKPPKLHQDHLDYLVTLRDSGKTNMWGAGPFLQRKFPALTDSEAGAILIYWIESLS